jgi:hypothetical protein
VANARSAVADQPTGLAGGEVSNPLASVAGVAAGDQPFRLIHSARRWAPKRGGAGGSTGGLTTIVEAEVATSGFVAVPVSVPVGVAVDATSGGVSVTGTVSPFGRMPWRPGVPEPGGLESSKGAEQLGIGLLRVVAEFHRDRHGRADDEHRRGEREDPSRATGLDRREFLDVFGFRSGFLFFRRRQFRRREEPARGAVALRRGRDAESRPDRARGAFGGPVRGDSAVRGSRIETGEILGEAEEVGRFLSAAERARELGRVVDETRTGRRPVAEGPEVVGLCFSAHVRFFSIRHRRVSQAPGGRGAPFGRRPGLHLWSRPGPCG